MHRKKFRRTLKILISFLLLILVAAILLVYMVFHLRHQSSKSAVGPTYIQKIAGPTEYKSGYFKFSDTNKWIYSAADSTPNMITFLQYQGGVLAYSFSVYINQVPQENNLAVTHVLPVQIKDGNSFNVGAVSDDCKSVYGGSPDDIKEVTIAGISMLCVPDSPQYTIIAGQTGGNYQLSLKRRDGQTASYIIIYKDLTVNPDADPFLTVMKSFTAL